MGQCSGARPGVGAVNRDEGGEGVRGAESRDGQPDGPTFEEAMAELERIVRDLETGALGLDEALRLYERGVALVRRCGGQLDGAEARLRILTLDGEGNPVLAALEGPGA